MTKRTVKQMSDARRVGLATVLFGASCVLLVTIYVSSKADAATPPPPATPKPLVFGMALSCTPIPESKDYLCTVRMVKEGTVPNNSPTPPVINSKAKKTAI